MKRILLSTIFTLMYVHITIAQCDMCKKVLESNQESGLNNIGSGLNEGIFYLIGFPYLLVLIRIALVQTI